MNIHLNPDFIGKGLGVEVIRHATEKVFSELNINKPIVAEIKSGNAASRKTFSKAGYVCTGQKGETVFYKKESRRSGSA